MRASQSTRCERSRWPYLLAGMCVAVLCAFLLLPGSIASKAHLALHGICAQRPSHSLVIGGEALPLDARMSGIYIGAAVTGTWLLAAGNARNTQTPALRVVATLALFVILLAADGLNALAFDLGLPHPYQPFNELRLATGILAGTAMGVAVTFLLAVTMWARGDRARAVVERPTALAAPLGIAAALGALALSGMPMLYAPFAIGLVAAAVGVFAMLGTIALALVGNRGWTYESYWGMGALACAGLVAGIGLIAALAGVRLVLESWFELPRLT